MSRTSENFHNNTVMDHEGMNAKSIRIKMGVVFTIIAFLLITGSIGGFNSSERNKEVMVLAKLIQDQKGLIELIARKLWEYVGQEGDRKIK